MIRQIHHSDMDAVVDMARRGFVETGIYADDDINDDHVETFVNEVIYSPFHDMFAAVVEGEIVGLIGVGISELFFNREIRACDQTFIYVAPEFRSKGLALLLREHMEKFAKRKGCRFVTYHNYDKPDDLTGERYHRYQHKFIKKVS